MLDIIWMKIKLLDDPTEEISCLCHVLDQILGKVRLVLALRAPEDAPAVLPLPVVVEGASHPAELPDAPLALEADEHARFVVVVDLGAGKLLRAVRAVYQ